MWRLARWPPDVTRAQSLRDLALILRSIAEAAPTQEVGGGG